MLKFSLLNISKCLNNVENLVNDSLEPFLNVETVLIEPLSNFNFSSIPIIWLSLNSFFISNSLNKFFKALIKWYLAIVLYKVVGDNKSYMKTLKN